MLVNSYEGLAGLGAFGDDTDTADDSGTSWVDSLSTIVTSIGKVAPSIITAVKGGTPATKPAGIAKAPAGYTVSPSGALVKTSSGFLGLSDTTLLMVAGGLAAILVAMQIKKRRR